MTRTAIVCFVVALILTGLALSQLRSIRLGLPRASGLPEAGSCAFVDDDGSDDDGSDDEGGELLHSANVRYVYNVGRRASTRLCEGPTRKLVFGEAIRMLHGIVQSREVDVSRSPQAGSFHPDPGHRRGDITRCAMSLLLAVAVAVWSW